MAQSASVLELGDGLVPKTCRRSVAGLVLGIRGTAGQPRLRELLQELKASVDADTQVPDETRAEALKEVNELAKAAQDPKGNVGPARRAMNGPQWPQRRPHGNQQGRVGVVEACRGDQASTTHYHNLLCGVVRGVFTPLGGQTRGPFTRQGHVYLDGNGDGGCARACGGEDHSASRAAPIRWQNSPNHSRRQPLSDSGRAARASRSSSA